MVWAEAPGDPAGTGAAIPVGKFSSLSLPKELLYSDQTVPETTDAITSGDKPNLYGSPSDAAGVLRAAWDPRESQPCYLSMV